MKELLAVYKAEDAYLFPFSLNIKVFKGAMLIFLQFNSQLILMKILHFEISSRVISSYLLVIFRMYCLA